jgi:hypothetical protein
VVWWSAGLTCFPVEEVVICWAGGRGLAMLRDDAAEADAGFLVPYLLPADNKRHLQGALLLQDLERRGQSGSLW